MPRTKRRSKHHDSSDTDSGVGALYIDDHEMDEDELLHLLDHDFAPTRHNTATEEFSWDVYLENSWSERRYY